MDKLGILHPGEMGVTVALAAQNTGQDVLWASAGRSMQTQDRANKIGLIDAGTLPDLSKTCSTIICVCPPAAAEEIAAQVAALDYKGLYIDANAISPQRVLRIAGLLHKSGISFVDGSIIGGPAWEPDTTRLYLSGEQASLAATKFSAGPIGVQVIGDSIGQASALKMCYAAYTKGNTALLCGILAASEALDVRDELMAEWEKSGSGLAQEAPRRARRVTGKAWRFSGEMQEIAATFESVGLPGGFHNASADIYNRLSKFKGSKIPELEDVINSLLMNESPNITTDRHPAGYNTLEQ